MVRPSALAVLRLSTIFHKLAAEQAELEAVIAASAGDKVEHQLEIAADALRLPPCDAPRVVAACRRLWARYLPRFKSSLIRLSTCLSSRSFSR